MINAIVLISKLSPLFASIVCLFLGAGVYWFQRNSRKHYLFLVFSLILGIWAFACFVQSITKNYFLALIFDQVLYSAAVFAPTVFLSYTAEFTQKDRRKIIFYGYIVSFILLLSNFSPLFRDGVVLLFRNRFVTIPAIGWYFYIIFFSVFVSLAIYDLFLLFARSSGEEKNHVKFILFSCAFLILGGISYFALIVQLATFPFDVWLNLISSMVLAIYEIIISYAMTKHRLMNIRIIISRAFAEILTLSFWSSIYLAIFWFYRNYISSQIDLPFLLLNLIYGAIVGRTHHKIRLFLQTTADKLFLHGKYDYYKALSDVGSQIIKRLSMENILRILNQTFHEIVEVSNPRIYLRDDFDKPEVKPFLEVKALSFKDEELVIPCRIEGRPIAIIVLGRKLSEDPYTQEDLQLLTALASQTAIAIDHTRTYEELKKDYEANQKKLYDTERLLARSEKIASLASLIREYNHEIKTPLAIIRNNIALLPDDPRLAEFKKITVLAIHRANDIVESTLRLGEPRERREVELDLNEVIEQALKLFPPSGVHLVKELSPLPHLKGDQEDLQTVFVNLIKNSVEAMPRGGTLKVATYSGVKDDQPTVFAAISDTGVGIPTENIEKIFEPFFSTHVTKGRGLGLSIVFRIIREHLGRIEVKSQLGQGATFTVCLPIPS